MLHYAMRLLSTLHLKGMVAQMWRWQRASERQAAWVTIIGAILWGILNTDRAYAMAVYAGIAALCLYVRSWQEKENRTGWLVVAGLMFVAFELLKPGSEELMKAYDLREPPMVSIGRDAFRVVGEVAVFLVMSALITKFRRSFPDSLRFLKPPAPPE